MIQKLKNKALALMNRKPKIVASKNKNGSININCYPSVEDGFTAQKADERKK